MPTKSLSVEEVIKMINEDLASRIRHIKENSGPDNYVNLRTLVKSVDEILN